MKISRRSLITSAAFAAVGTSSPPGLRSAAARAPIAEAQVPGVIRRKIGTVEVTALLDGYITMPTELFNLPPKIANQLERTQFPPVSSHLSPINAFVVNLGDRLVLIDTGSANSLGATAGKLPSALAAAGIKPEQIDAILLTHMHPDHIAGAIDPNGQAVFPNAEMIVAEADFKYWHDDASMREAPEPFKPFFLGARTAANAYRSRVTKLSTEATIFDSLKSVALVGHTPGHTGYMLSSGKETLFIWADTVHHAAFQMTHPEWGPAFDVDPKLAAKSRARALDMATSERLMVAGMHMPFPGIGHIAKEKVGYRFFPAEWPYSI